MKSSNLIDKKVFFIKILFYFFHYIRDGQYNLLSKKQKKKLNKAKDYYKNNDESLKEHAKNKYKNLSEEEKIQKREYGKNRYHNLSEEDKNKVNDKYKNLSEEDKNKRREY